MTKKYEVEDMSKVAIVTGAGQGIGFAIAKRLHADGFKIGILDYNEETAQAAVDKLSPEDAVAVVADVSKRDQVFDAFQKVVDTFGDLNVVVNNAGVAPTTPLDTITEEQFEKAFAINVGGTIWGSQAAQKHFRELGHGGKIINATSQAGCEWNPNLTVYGGTNLQFVVLHRLWQRIWHQKESQSMLTHQVLLKHL